MRRRRWPRALVVALALVAAPCARAEAPAPELQAAIFRKVLGYVRTLGDGAAPRVVAVAGRASGPEATSVAAAFRALGVQATALPAGAAVPPLDASTVLYVPGDAATDELLAAAARAGALTVSPSAELVQQARASIALRARHDGRTEIVVHLGRARDERHVLSSYLLGIATVWQ